MAVDHLRQLVGNDLAVPVAEVLADTGNDHRDEQAVADAVALLREVEG